MASHTRTHLLRVKPPWRDGGDRTRCGRRVRAEGQPHWRAETDRGSVIEPDQEMAAKAAADWRARFRMGSPQIPVVKEAPEGVCVPCWQNLGAYGLKTWRTDPLEVLRIDLAVTDDAGRKMLVKEFIALAGLVAAHKDEFRDLMDSEAALKALAAIGSR